MVEIEVEGEYGKGIVTYPDTVKSGRSMELTAIWIPESFVPLRTLLRVYVTWVGKYDVAHIYLVSYFGKESEVTKKETVTVGIAEGKRPVPPGETLDVEVWEKRGFGFLKGHRIHVGTIQVEE